MPFSADSLIADTQARHRARIAALDAMAREYSALGEDLSDGLTERETVWDRVADGPWPAALSPHLKKLLRAVPLLGGASAEPASGALLERKLERVQRELIRLDLHLERVAADRDALNAEMQALTAQVEEGASKLERVRLRSALGLHHEFMQLTHAVEAHLRELREASAETLDALDRQLARLAAEAHARDLAEVVAEDLDDIRAAVARVNHCAAEGAVLLTENLDRLSSGVDLLSPATPERLAAEREVSGSLQRDDIDDLLRYTREQVQRNKDLRRRLEPDDA